MVITAHQFEQLAPFWSLDVIDQLFIKLVQAGRVQNHGSPVTESQQLRFSLLASPTSSQTAPHVASQLPAARVGNRTRGHSLITDSWRPNSSVLEQLRTQGIDDSISLGQISAFIAYWQERGEPARAWGPKFVSWVTSEHRRQAARQSSVVSQPSSVGHPSAASDQPDSDSINRHWQPDPDAVMILERIDINRAFINQILPEFTLYWRERGVPTNTWNSLFIQFAKKKHAEVANGSDGLPKPIAADWQPDQKAYDILQMSDISQGFAAEQVASFVMFWRDSGKADRSWNTRFINHVKYRWQHKDQPLQSGQSNDTDTRQRSIIKSLTDTSWADGIELGS